MDILLERILSLVPNRHGGDKEFALSIGYKSGNVIADWRAGRSKSYKGKVQEISRVYGVSVDWLCGNDDKKENPTVSGEVDIKAWLNGRSDSELLQIIAEATRMMQEKK